LRYLTPNDVVGGYQCVNTNNIYNCQFVANTNGTSIDNPETASVEYLKLALRTFNGTQDLSVSSTCFLSNGKLICNDINLANLPAGDYYHYFVGNHYIQWMNFGKLTIGAASSSDVNLIASKQNSVECPNIINYSCIFYVNVYVENKGTQDLEWVDTVINIPNCVNFSNINSSTSDILQISGKTAKLTIPTLPKNTTKGYKFTFVPTLSGKDGCQSINNNSSAVFKLQSTLQSKYNEQILYNNYVQFEVLIDKSVG